MDQLPCELLHYILRYIYQPLELLQMSHVCRRWRSFIMEDESFLNQWFLRLLLRSQPTFSHARSGTINKSKQQSILNIDQSLFPINLRSSRCYILPCVISRDSFRHDIVLSRFYFLPIGPSHSFSFWIFLPYQCKLKIRTSYPYTNDITILLCNVTKYDSNQGKCILTANRWIHIFFTKRDLHYNYKTWIDGQCVSQHTPYHPSFNKTNPSFSFIENASLHEFENDSLEVPNKILVADLNVFKRCLTLFEVRAIHQQQTSVSQVKVGTYIKSNDIHNMRIGYPDESNDSSWRFILFLFVLFLIFLIHYSF